MSGTLITTVDGNTTIAPYGAEQAATAVAAAVMATAADRAQTGLDAAATAADAVATAADVVSTTALKDAAITAVAAAGAYSDTTLAAALVTGLAAVAEGETFRATGDDVSYVGFYTDIAGVATETVSLRVAKPSYISDVLNGVNPGNGNELALVHEQLSTTSAGGSVPNSSGTRSNGTPYWDIPVSTLSGDITVFLKKVSGTIVVTVSQRDATTEIVAPVAVTLAGDIFEKTVTKNASATIFRVALTSTGATEYWPPSVGQGRPATVPNDDDYVASLLERLGVNDGVPINRIISFSGSGTTINTINNSFTVPTASSNGVGRYLLTQDVPTTAKLTGLLTLSSTALAPRAVTYQFLDARGNANTAAAVNLRWEGPDKLYFTADATVSGSPVAQVYILIDTRTGGGQNNAAAGAVTATLELYASDSVPKVRALPAFVSDSIDAKISAAIVADDSRVQALIDTAVSKLLGGAAIGGLLSGAIAAFVDAQYFVDPVYGSDGNDGSRLTPFQTITAAVDAAHAYTLANAMQCTIALKRSVFADTSTHHFLDSSGVELAVGYNTTDAINSPNVNVIAYGLGSEPANIDGRLSLSGQTWTAVAGKPNTWETVAVHRQATIDNYALALTADRTHYRLWVGNDALEWKYNEANIAAMEAAVDGQAASWAVNLVGQTAPDPRRAAANGTDHRYIIHMADGSDPNGADIYVADMNSSIGFYGGKHRDLVLWGCHGKDNSHSRKDKYGLTLTDGTIGDFAWLHSIGFLECPAHGIVGPIRRFSGHCVGTGRAPEGLSTATYSAGGMFVMFTSTYYSTADIFIDGETIIEATGFGKVIYGHGSGNKGYRALQADPTSQIIAHQCGTPVQFDPAGTVSFIGNVTYYNITANLCQAVSAVAADNLIIDGFDAVFGTPDTTRTIMVSQDVVGSTTIRNGYVTGGHPNNFIASGVTGRLATVNIENVIDRTEVGINIPKMGIYNSGSNALAVNLVNCQFGDFKAAQSSVTLAGLTMDATSRGGLNAGTQATIEALGGAFSITAGAEIVNSNDRLIAVAT